MVLYVHRIYRKAYWGRAKVGEEGDKYTYRYTVTTRMTRSCIKRLGQTGWLLPVHKTQLSSSRDREKHSPWYMEAGGGIGGGGAELSIVVSVSGEFFSFSFSLSLFFSEFSRRVYNNYLSKILASRACTVCFRPDLSTSLRCLFQAWPLFLKILTWVCDVCFRAGLSF